MKRGFVVAIGLVALVLGLIILVRGIVEHGSLLYDLFGVLFMALGVARLYDARRRSS
jgi:uncharacterized membrane protein HdeD (DUF308 family)